MRNFSPETTSPITSRPLDERALKRAFQRYAEAQFSIFQVLGPLPGDLKWPVLYGLAWYAC